MATPQPAWQVAHDEADRESADGYFDPETGLFVMTKGYLLRKGTCCSSGCRHCPYGNNSPASPERAQKNE